MGLTVKASGVTSQFKQVPPGMHLARCYRVIDMGTQITTWKGATKQQPKVMLQFEVHSEDASGHALITDKGEPLSISKTFTASLGENAILRQELENWRSRAFTQEELNGFELKNVLGAWALLSVVKEVGNDGNEYTNISSINPVSSQMKKAGLPDPHNELTIFDMEDPNMELFETFSNKMKEKLQATPEWKERFSNSQSFNPVTAPKKGFEDMDSDIPF
jgi:hypothetical protein